MPEARFCFAERGFGFLSEDAVTDAFTGAFVDMLVDKNTELVVVLPLDWALAFEVLCSRRRRRWVRASCEVGFGEVARRQRGLWRTLSVNMLVAWSGGWA